MKKEEDIRIIRVKSCGECPYKNEDKISDYTTCKRGFFIIKGFIVITAEDVYFDMSKIHPKCPLEKGDH